MITAFAPASIANISCGFDVLGLAIAAPGDEVTVSFNALGYSRITDIQGDLGKLPYELEKNTAGKAIAALCTALGETRGIDIKVHKKMPFGSGMGSSAASAVAAVVAANALLGNPLTKHELLPFALDGEAVASGARHADNVAPSLLGGMVLVRSHDDPSEVLSLPIPSNLYYSLIHPDVEILTKEARNILPKVVSMQDAITQSANLGSLVVALYENDLALLGRSIQDSLAEPYRKALLPAFDKVKNAALYGGALAFGISGSGPSMFAFADGLAKAKQIADLMQRCLQREKISSNTYCGKVNTRGAHVIG